MRDQAAAQHHIFLVPGYEFAEALAAELRLNHELMPEEILIGAHRVAGRKRLRLQFDGCLGVNQIDHLPGRKGAAELVGDGKR